MDQQNYQSFMPTPETAEKKVIKDYLTLKGIFWYWNLQGLGCCPGVGDLVAIRNGVTYQIEVKVGKSKQSEKQREFQSAWEKNGGKYICGGLREVMEKIV